MMNPTQAWEFLGLFSKTVEILTTAKAVSVLISQTVAFHTYLQ
jgi:hypothetical protein